MESAKLESINLEGVKTIQGSSFYGNSRLKMVALPDVETVGPGAFCMCSDLTSISLPSIVTIEASAFAMCGNLADFYFGDSLQTIQMYSFLTDPSSTEIGFEKRVIHYGTSKTSFQQALEDEKVKVYNMETGAQTTGEFSDLCVALGLQNYTYGFDSYS